MSERGVAMMQAIELMDRLRATGPWESVQTHESLRRYLIEETYEFLDAMTDGSRADLREELADLLLQVLFHSAIAADDPDDPFTIDDVAQAFLDKISARSARVLAGDTDIEAQLRQWEERKAAEKSRDSIFDGVATSQPALALVQKVIERLDAANFPRDLIPADIVSVDIAVVMATDPAVSVEDWLRNAVRAFMDRVRLAEKAMPATGSRDAAVWRAHLPQ